MSTQRVGTLIKAPIRIENDNIPAPSAFADEINGGLHTVNTVADRDNTPGFLRRFGMIVNVTVDSSTNVGAYQLWPIVDSNVLNNANWKRLNALSDTIGIGLGSLTFTFPFDGSAGNGAVGALNLPVINMPVGCFIKEVLVDIGAGLTAGAGSYITMGVQTDNETAALDAETGLVDTLNSAATGVTDISTPVYTKATAARVLVAAVNVADITAGTLRIIIILSDFSLPVGVSDSGILLQTDGVSNDVQSILNLVDSATVQFVYLGSGQVTANYIGAMGGGGTPGGADTQMQFNDGGAFGGAAEVVYDKTASVERLGIGYNAIGSLPANTRLSLTGLPDGLGTEEVKNGGFATDASFWTFSGNWSRSGAAMLHASANDAGSPDLRQLGNLVVGASYHVEFTGSGGGNFYIFFGGNAIFGMWSGFISFDITYNTAVPYLIGWKGTTAFAGTITGVSIKRNLFTALNVKDQIFLKDFANAGNQNLSADNNGKVFAVPDFIPITKPDADYAIANNLLLPGKTYQISGVHPTLYNDGTTSGTTVLLQAFNNNQFVLEGKGIFYNPNYGLYNVWKNYGTWAVTPISGSWPSGDTITADNGATGLLLGTINTNYFIPLTGNWPAAVSIIGGGGGLASIASVSVPTYSIGDKVIYGAYVWSNVNGNIGAATDVMTLDSEWLKANYATPDYVLAIDNIGYDYANDFICKRHEEALDNIVTYNYTDANVFLGGPYSAITVFAFGRMMFSGNSVYNSYVETVNMVGTGAVVADNIFSGACYVYNNVFIENSQIYTSVFSASNASGNIVISSTIAFSSFTANSTLSSNTLFASSALDGNNFIGALFSSNEMSAGTIQNTSLSFGGFGNNKITASTISNCTFTSGSGITYCNITAGISYCNFTEGSSLNVGLGNSIPSAIQNLTASGAGSINVDISAATVIFAIYDRTLYQRPDGSFRIRYYNNSDALVIVAVTA